MMLFDKLSRFFATATTDRILCLSQRTKNFFSDNLIFRNNEKKIFRVSISSKKSSIIRLPSALNFVQLRTLGKLKKK